MLISILNGGLAFPAELQARQSQDTTRLETITVTATRVPVSATSLTSSITVLRGEELRARGITHVLEALRAVPGLHVVQGGSFGAATSVFLRGGESDYVQVLIDGVPVNQPGGAYNYAHLTTVNVDRIEIVRGPTSVLYGSDAMSGVVQIFTRQGDGAMQGSAEARGGTYNSFGFGAGASGGTERTSYSFAVDRSVSDGAYAFNNDYDNTVLSGRFQVRPDAATDLAFSLRYRDSKFHFPTDGSGNLVDRNAFTLDEATTISLDAGRFLTDQVELRVLVASNVINGGSDDSQDDASDTLGFYAFRSIQNVKRQSIDARSNVYLAPAVVLTGGAQFEQQEERSFNESESEFGPSGGSSESERSNRAYYAQLLAEFSGLSFVAGGRLDDNEAFGTFGTYRAGAAYTVSGTKLRASVGRGFKAPTFFENFATGFVIGNPNLQPEQSVSWEAGVRQGIGNDRVVVAATYFHQSFEDLIQFTFADTPNYFNVAEARASGVEVEATARPVQGLVLSANYTWLATEVIDAGFDSGEGATFVQGARLLRRPTHAFAATAAYRGWDRGGFHVTLNHVGDRDDRDFSAFPGAPVVLPAYTTVDVAAEFHLLQSGSTGLGLTSTLRLENVFDLEYAEVFGFPARGRAVFVGGKVRR
ncbi:MAG: TonB-dependent receptor [Gemmatimonadales bacterium]